MADRTARGIRPPQDPEVTAHGLETGRGPCAVRNHPVDGIQEIVRQGSGDEIRYRDIAGIVHPVHVMVGIEMEERPVPHTRPLPHFIDGIMIFDRDDWHVTAAILYDLWPCLDYIFGGLVPVWNSA
jgi:hypothetical protein